MKKNIHPKTNLITVTCACGNSFETLSTVNEMKVEVCSACHPFFTGTQRYVDTAGRVEKFQQKLEAQKRAAAEAAARKAKKLAPKTSTEKASQ